MARRKDPPPQGFIEWIRSSAGSRAVPARNRAIVLYTIYGKSVEEVAGMYGLSPTRISRIRMRVFDQYRQWAFE